MTIQTNVVWNRSLTSEESTSLQAQLANDVAAGTTDGTFTGGPDNTMNPVVRIWTTTDAANAWIAFLNTYSPAPVSATVTS
jgi:hypothetical protein